MRNQKIIEMKFGVEKTSDKYESEQSTDLSIVTNDSSCTTDIETLRKQYRLLQLESDMHKSRLEYVNAELAECRKNLNVDVHNNLKYEKFIKTKNKEKYCSHKVISSAEEYCDKLQNVSDFYEKEEEDILKSIRKKIRYVKCQH